MTDKQNSKTLLHFKHEFESELHSILSYWADRTIDELHGGFLGEIDEDDQPNYSADKGLVLNSRILWSFAAAASQQANTKWIKLADRAYAYIRDYFIDNVYGGAYWSVNADGSKKDTKKQTYGIAFCIYGLSEYVKLNGDKEALSLAIQLYNDLEKNALDGDGYIEAFTQDWSTIDDLRLSNKDANTPKTTNTHLHIIEAYANLYQVWPNEGLKQNIDDILFLFHKHIIDEKYHLKLFFTKDWASTENTYSFGHDIEAAWLLQHCANVSNNKGLKSLFAHYAVIIADETLPWLDDGGGLFYELNLETGVLNKEKHWWVQAEAMLGFYNAYQLTGKQEYLVEVVNVWSFIKRYLLDKVHGEWYWGVNANYQLMNEPKVGFWKCPYHNTRACLELLNRLSIDFT